jgi:hypothetical protein
LKQLQLVNTITDSDRVAVLALALALWKKRAREFKRSETFQLEESKRGVSEGIEDNMSALTLTNSI